MTKTKSIHFKYNNEHNVSLKRTCKSCKLYYKVMLQQKNWTVKNYWIDFFFLKREITNDTNTTLYVMSPSFITFSESSIHTRKLMNSLPLQKSIINTSSPARNASAQTQLAPSHSSCLTCTYKQYTWCV